MDESALFSFSRKYYLFGRFIFFKTLNDFLNKGIDNFIDSSIAVSFRFNDISIFQNRQMLGYDRLRQFEAFPQVGNTGILPLNQQQYLKAERMTADL